MTEATTVKPVDITGISYYYPPVYAVLYARDGKVQIPYGDIPIPLQKEEFDSLAGLEPTYDQIGRGIYHALRANPDAPFSNRYAFLLRDAYPHLLAELATHLVMLDNKDVDLPYLDRKISYLKIFALLEPENHRFPLEIGATFLGKGLSLGSLANTTVLLYRAEGFLQKALAIKPDDFQTRHQLGELSYLLGKYDKVIRYWEGLHPALSNDVADRVARRLEQIASGKLPAVPLVDYLQAVGVALEAYESGEWEEAAAIIFDVMDVLQEFEELPLAELNYLLALCYIKLEIPRYAEQYLRQAIALRPGYEEAERELTGLTGGG